MDAVRRWLYQHAESTPDPPSPAERERERREIAEAWKRTRGLRQQLAVQQPHGQRASGEFRRRQE